jgi:hypothetical protein
VPREVSSADVYAWPEFRALCARLGIDLRLRTVRLVIELSPPSGGDHLPARVVHEYQGDDHAPR